MVKLRNIIVSVISVCIIGVLIWITDFSPLQEYLSTHMKTLLGLGLLATILFIARAFRLFFVFKQHEETSTSLTKFIPPGFIGATIATFVPFKSGELIAVELYYNELDISHSKSLSVIVISRALDILVVLFFVLLGILTFPIINSGITGIWLTILSVSIFLGLTILLSKQLGLKFLYLFEPVLKKLSLEIWARLERITINYYDHVEFVLNSKPERFHILLWTAIRWGGEICFYLLLFRSFAFNISPIMVIPVIGVAYAIGVSSGTPGAIGTFQLSAVAILATYGIDPSIGGLSLVIGSLIVLSTNIIYGSTGFLLTYLPKFFSSTK